MDFTKQFPQTFMGVENAGLDAADVITLPVPFEGAVCFTPGAALGPAAIIRASIMIDRWDEELRWEPGTLLKFHTVDAVAHEEHETPADYHHKLEQAAAQLRGSKSFILSLGGDHSITAPILYGLGVDISKLTIVHIDAHPDLLVNFQDMKESHASVMHRLWSDGASLIQMGIRTVDRSEYELSESSDRIEIHYAHSLQRPEHMQALLARLRALRGPVYLSVDVDGLDPSVIPGTGTPQPGGLTWYQAMDIFRALLLESEADVFAADVVETIPLKEVPVSEFNAAKLAFKIVSYKYYRSRHE